MSAGHWQLEGDAAELYERYLVPTITGIWARDLLDRAAPRPYDAILDVACGTGIVARLAAKRTTGGRIIGIDLNAGMLSVARRVTLNDEMIDWIEGSALALPLPDGSVDLALCQLGLQFFPDPARALREMRRVVKSAGRVAVNVYGPIERTPGAYAFVRALDLVLGPEASRVKRGEHAFAEADELRDLLLAAGFQTVEVEDVEHRIEFPSVGDYVRFQLLATPMAALLQNRSTMERQDLIDAIAFETDRLCPSKSERFIFQQHAFVALAQ